MLRILLRAFVNVLLLKRNKTGSPGTAKHAGASAAVLALVLFSEAGAPIQGRRGTNPVLPPPFAVFTPL